ncbi:uncharacterized protein LOC131648657 [Vicia villosa]|uniref:uncharacterized protein LOC131648657 n=1 Tax=Vicia villosa TaxID=3911 RepID=UPI00273B86E7|nr:uncharacterized protein LOC131648657 [Vicia villosa]
MASKFCFEALEKSLRDIMGHDKVATKSTFLTNLIILDEAPMASKFCFEALGKSLKDIMGHDKVASKSIFGGKIVVFDSDFRQILPVVPRGTRSDIVHSTINASYIWDHYKVLTLTKNMCLQVGTNLTNTEEIHNFPKWILQVGEGKISELNDGYVEISIPPELLLTYFVNPVEKIVTSTYPNILENYTDSIFLKSRAILASTIEAVDEINDYVINLLPGDAKEFLSSDSIDRCEANDNDGFEHLTHEFLSCLKCSDFPNHSMQLKVRTCIYHVDKKFGSMEGFYNGTRLTVTKLANHVIEAKIKSGIHVGNTI